MRSGTNQYHGSVYDYAANEFLNAGIPYTNAGLTNSQKSGQLVRPRARRHDYGFTIGGPIRIPKVYNGTDKSFFFFNWEEFRETQVINNISQTVPVAAYRNGDFSSAITAGGGNVLALPGGGPITSAPINTIFDPATRRTVGGFGVMDPFPNNTIPMARFDRVSAKVQAQIPLQNLPGFNNNYLPSYPSKRQTPIPSVKLDQQVGSGGHLSFYWSRTHTNSQYSPTFGQSDGFPDIITQARGTFIHSHVERLNYDHTVTPTVLMHLGVGYQHNHFLDAAPITDFDAEAFYGLRGATVKRNTPNFTGFCPAGVCSGAAAGGMQNMGPANSGQVSQWQQKPSANASATWVKSNHTYKFGGEFFQIGVPVRQFAQTNGNYAFSANQTSLPYLAGQTIPGGSIGFAYASFLLGQVDQATIAPFSSFRSGKINLGFFAQDSWKATRKMTVDYGVRWDFGTAQTETYGRFANFSPTTLNPRTNRLGGFIYEGGGPGGCNCNFARNYKGAFGPRLGVAYNLSPKTVLRAGIGVVYGQTNPIGLGTAASGVIPNTGQGASAFQLQDGIDPTRIPTWHVDFLLQIRRKNTRPIAAAKSTPA